MRRTEEPLRGALIGVNVDGVIGTVLICLTAAEIVGKGK